MMNQRWNNSQSNICYKECVEYFRNRPVMDKLLRGFLEKYKSYGSFSGTVILRNLNMDEIEDLEGFFQKNYHGKKSASISAERFEKVLKNSRFREIEPVELLNMYFHEKIVAKKDQKLEEDQKWKQLFAKLENITLETPAKDWLISLQNAKSSMHSYLMKSYRESSKDMKKMEEILLLCCRIVNALPYRGGGKEYLPVFAAMVTGNPHAFDDNTKGGQLLYMLVQWELKQRDVQIENSTLFPTLKKQKMYLAVGILRDDISNYGMISGIRAWKKDGKLHAGMKGFLEEGDMVQVPLSVIADWKTVECPENAIYIVENPSIYAMLCNKWRGKKACMCMNGQPRLSSLLLLDLLAKAKVKVFYAGDFDPEGLLIAQKIKQYYHGKFEYWYMTPSVYEQSRSEEHISERRLKMLERIADEELITTAHAMNEYKKAGYQENVWRIYVYGVI